MKFDLDQRRARMSVGDLSDFSIGPVGSVGGSGGIWRAQLGTHWHNELRAQVLSEGADADFEVPVEGEVARRGWVISLSGRIDQIVRTGGQAVLREIKTVTRALPAPEAELRADYPGYFVQAATYAALRGAGERCELVFVETDTGLAQVVAVGAADEGLLGERLDRVAEFLDLRLRARERLRGLRFRPAFPMPREGPGRRRGGAHGRRPGRPGANPPRGADRLRQDGHPPRVRAPRPQGGPFRPDALHHGQVDRPDPGRRDAAGDDRARARTRRRSAGRRLAREEQGRALRQLGLPVREGGLRVPGRRRGQVGRERPLPLLPPRRPAEGPRLPAQRRSRRQDMPVRDHAGRAHLQRCLDRRLHLRLRAGKPGPLLRPAGVRPGEDAPHHRRGPQPRLAGGRRALALLCGRRGAPGVRRPPRLGGPRPPSRQDGTRGRVSSRRGQKCTL